MLKTYVGFEWFKLKRQKVSLLLIIVPLISVLLGIGNFFGNYDVLMDQPDDNAWLEMWTQITLFYGILFLPISSGIFAALVCRTDHLNGGWKLQFALPVSRSIIYWAKLIVILSLVLIMQLILLVCCLIAGKIAGIDDTIPIGFMLGAILLSWLGTFSLCAIQLWLSYRIKSFGIPLSINIVLALMVFAAFASKWGMLYPWAQPAFAIAAPQESPVESMPLFIASIVIIFGVLVTLISARFGKSDLKV